MVKLCGHGVEIVVEKVAVGVERSKGTPYFVLHPQGLQLRGRWVGTSYDGPIQSGWATMAHDHPEARVALHTRRSLVPRIVAETIERHAYDVPSVSALPIIDGSPAYLDWIRESTTAADA